MVKKILVFFMGLFLLGSLSLFAIYYSVKKSLPKMVTIKDYEPLMVTQVFDRNNKKIGEFARERRILVPFEKIPKQLVQAFMAAEDDQFYEHSGINYQSILRATLANIRAGRSVQGGSTITQQVAKTLMLSSEKTLTRKLKDILLALEMEKNLSKEDILFLYLNQIYFGQGAYGVELAAQTYFRKSVQDLTLPEMAILAGLPQAPSRYSPVRAPKKAKERQLYVLRRMVDVGFVTKEVADAAVVTPVKVYVREKFEEIAPFYLETIRQLLVEKLGENALLDKGLFIYTGLDIENQKAAQESVRQGLRTLDKRQGYRGVLKHLDDPEDIQKLLTSDKERIINESFDQREILPNGEVAPLMMGNAFVKNVMPAFLKVDMVLKAVVSEVNDPLGVVKVELPEYSGIIDIETMSWARKPNKDIRWDLDRVTLPSVVLKKGDVIDVRITKNQYTPSLRLLKLFKKNPKNKNNTQALPSFEGLAQVELEQDPIAEGALISFDTLTEDIISMVGGRNFELSEFNRAIQAPRQTGSAFKTIVYASALDKGFTPSTSIMDAPLVFEDAASENQGDEEGQEEQKTWKPTNHSKSFGGDITFRNALVQSLNVPTVKVIENIGVNWVLEYAQRLGIFSPLNRDFTLALGSSSVTLYEMTKVFSHFSRLGKRIRPILIRQVKDRFGNELIHKISLDARNEKETQEFEKNIEEKRLAYLNLQEGIPTEETVPPTVSPFPANVKIEDLPKIYFKDPDQLIKPTTAYVMTSLLKSVVEDPHGTGARARALGREVAGKTGTTNNYYDAWFIGYTPQITTGVWVGFDHEKSLGKGEVGGRAALPIWLDFMKAAHTNLPLMTFPAPEGIVFANIDIDTGKIASEKSQNVIRQPYEEGTEPQLKSDKAQDAADFLKQDINNE